MTDSHLSVVNGAETPELWREQLLRSNNGAPFPVLANAIMALRGAADWKGKLSYDEMHASTILTMPPPWFQGTEWTEREWTDTDDLLLAEWLQRRGIRVGPQTATEAAEVVARDKAFHPIRSYLTGLKWDGIKRLETWTLRLLGVADTPLARAVSMKWMVAAVARVMRPGVKADHCLVLEGPQGLGKSTVLQILGSQWYSELTPDIGNKDAMGDIKGVWIVELAELASLRRAEINKVKAYISRLTDRYRPPYGRRTIEQPRQCVFAGTVNPPYEWHGDESGGRRFWPLRCTRADLDGLRAERDQLWAEAVAYFNGDMPLWLEDRELQLAAEEEMMDRAPEDAWEAEMAIFLFEKDEVTLHELMADCLKLTTKDQDDRARQRIGKYLTKHAWHRHRHRDDITKKRGWIYRRLDITKP